MLERILHAVMVASLAFPVPVSPPRGCPGCVGLGSSSAASGGTCGGSVSISVTMRNGTCKWLATEEPVIVVCTPIVNCQPTVLRQWSGLGANTGLDFCVTANGETLCLINPPSAGPSGSGEDTRTSASMQCQDGAVRSFSIVSSSCGLSAAGEAICSSCVSH